MYFRTRVIFLCLSLLVFSLFTGCQQDLELKKHINNLTDDDPEERHDAAKALENMGMRAAPAVDDLAEALSDEDDAVRYRAAKALCKLGTAARNATASIARALATDGHEKVQYYSAKSLAEIASTYPEDAVVAVDDLRSALTCDAPKTRYYIVKALGKIGPEAAAAIPDLEACANDTDEKVRMAAKSALEKINKKETSS